MEIKKRYSHEIQDIDNKLRELEQGRIYEKSGARMDGYLATNIIELRKMIADLLWKIENNEPSTNDKIAEAFGKITKTKMADQNILETNIDQESELEHLAELLRNIKGKVYHWDDFEEGLGQFGKKLIIDKYEFKLKSSVSTMFEPDTIIAEAFENNFSGFEFCVFECSKKFFGEHDIEPSITALIADDKMYIVGYSKGLEI